MDKKVMEYIKQADQLQVNDMLLALANRYKELHSDHNVYLFAIPKADGEKRERELTQIVEWIRMYR